MLKKSITQALRTLSNPNEEFHKLSQREFEIVLGEYLILLISLAVLSGIVSFIYYLIKAFYLQLLYTIDIQYVRMMNYSLGRSTSLMFFYLFLGTFIIFIISMVLLPFLRKIKYISILKLLFYSVSPFLLFGWIPIFSLPLLLWSIFLFIVGVKQSKMQISVSKDSINNRD
jgi:hypothetical protein